MLSYCGPHILYFITHLINYCIETLSVLDGWKSSFLLPIPKVSAPEELKDLRLFSILGGVDGEYCYLYELLPSVQSGFRKNYSCATALLKVTDDILMAADVAKLTALVLFDYSKVFDRLNHQLFLAILQFLGFS